MPSKESPTAAEEVAYTSNLCFWPRGPAFVGRNAPPTGIRRLHHLSTTTRYRSTQRKRSVPGILHSGRGCTSSPTLLFLTFTLNNGSAVKMCLANHIVNVPLAPGMACSSSPLAFKIENWSRTIHRLPQSVCGNGSRVLSRAIRFKPNR